MWTDKQVKSFTAREKSYFVVENTQQRGQGRMALEVRPTGFKCFYFQYFTQGRRKLVSIGQYKDSAKTPGLTLAEARDQGLAHSAILRQGLDVKEFLAGEKREEEERAKLLKAEQAQGTFGQLLDEYVADFDRRGKRSGKNLRHALSLYVQKPFPELLAKKCSQVIPDDIKAIIKRMLDKSITTQCNRVRSMLHAAFQYGIKQDNDARKKTDSIKFHLQYNPVSGLPKFEDFERVGEYVIPEKDVRLVWIALDEQEVCIASVIKLALLTGQRPGEIIRLKWENFDLKDETLLIPSSVSKNKINHVVPLDELSMKVVKSLNDENGNFEYMFPGRQSGIYLDNVHVNSTSVSGVIRRVCSSNENITKFVPRDIRRTVKTLMGKAGVSKETRDRIQNHAIPDVSSKHYDRYDYIREKRKGIKIWNDYLDLIVHPQKNVTRLEQRKESA